MVTFFPHYQYLLIEGPIPVVAGMAISPKTADKIFYQGDKENVYVWKALVCAFKNNVRYHISNMSRGQITLMNGHHASKPQGHRPTGRSREQGKSLAE